MLSLPSCKEEALALSVSGLNGTLCTLSAGPSWTVLEVKSSIEAVAKVPVAEQRLLAGLHELANADRLGAAFCGLRAGGSAAAVQLTLVRRPPEQAAWLGNVRRQPYSLAQAPAEIRADREVAFEAAAASNGVTLRWTADELRRDRDFVRGVMDMCSPGSLVLRYADASLWADRDIVAAALRRNGRELSFAAPQLQADRGVVLCAVASYGDALRHASELLRADREVVLLALRSHGEALEFAAPQLRADRDVVLAAVRSHGGALRFACEFLRADAQVVLTAVRRGGCVHNDVFQHASLTLRSDRDFVLQVLQLSARSFRYVADALKDDKLVVLRALNDDPDHLAHASKRLRSDREVVLAAVARSGMALEFASKLLRGDREVVKVAIGECASALRYASEELRGDRSLVLAAIRQSYTALRYASERLRSDRQVVLAAIGKSHRALEFASEALRADRGIVLAALHRRPSSRASRPAVALLIRDGAEIVYGGVSRAHPKVLAKLRGARVKAKLAVAAQLRTLALANKGILAHRPSLPKVRLRRKKGKSKK